MTEVQLDLLERPLDEEAGERVHDGPQAGERHPGGGPHQELFPDADVDDPVRIPADGIGEGVRADLGEDDGDPGLVEQPGDDGERTGHGCFDGRGPFGRRSRRKKREREVHAVLRLDPGHHHVRPPRMRRGERRAAAPRGHGRLR
ncbi:hypothetical protein SHIRM173S_06288 [Streptomyces hirsutus]